MMTWGLFMKGSFLTMFQRRRLLLKVTARTTGMWSLGCVKHFAHCGSLEELQAKQNRDAWLLLNQVKMEMKHALYSYFKTPVAIIVSLCNACITLYRFAKLVIIYTPVLLLYPVSLLSPTLHSFWWKYFLLSIQISGPVFVKLSQWASTRRDIFSSSACLHLSSFQRDNRPHSWTSTYHVMEKAFGPGWQELFCEFSKKPVGSGCVAQVYQAYLKRDSMENKNETTSGVPFWKFWNKKESRSFSDSYPAVPVAVKVLHPSIKKEFEQNLSILHFCAKAAELILPSLRWLSLTDCVKEFEKFMFSQIDLVHEAKMLEVFHENFKTVENVNFPKPIWPFITNEVLVETWEEGIPISHFLSDNHPHLLKKKLADIGVDVLLKMVFNDNFVHSDLHPGNILVQNAGTRCVSYDEKMNYPLHSSDSSIFSAFNPTSVAFVILDCGLVSSLPKRDFSKFLGVFRAVALGQGEVVGELFLTHSVNECSNPDKFKNEMSEIISSARKNTLTLGKVDVGKLLGSVFSLLTTHRIKLESNFASLMLAIMVLEGLGRSLDPTMDMIEKAKPYLFNNVYPF